MGGRLPFWLSSILVVFHFGRPPFWSSSILVVLHFGHGPFWSSSILVVFHFGRLPFWSSSILVTFHFDRLPFWSKSDTFIVSLLCDFCWMLLLFRMTTDYSAASLVAINSTTIKKPVTELAIH